MTCPTILSAGRFGVQVETDEGRALWVHVDSIRNARNNIQASDCIELLGAVERATNQQIGGDAR